MRRLGGRWGLGPGPDGSAWNLKCLSCRWTPWTIAAWSRPTSAAIRSTWWSSSLLSTPTMLRPPSSLSPRQPSRPPWRPRFRRWEVEVISEGTLAHSSPGLDSAGAFQNLDPPASDVCSDPQRHVTPEGEEEPELSGAVCPAACVLPGVWYGEKNQKQNPAGTWTRSRFWTKFWTKFWPGSESDVRSEPDSDSELDSDLVLNQIQLNSNFIYRAR